jgi:succinoglycan biosynthesis transport protein ExoP
VLGMLPHVRNLTLASPARALSATDEEKPAKFSRQLLESATFYEESIRSILSTILLGRYGHPIRSLVVTSATEGEGKSSCVAHLAVANALQGRRTLLIDADLRCPTQHRMFTELRGNSQHRMFTLDQPEGLSDVIANGKHLREVRQSVKGIPKLDVIPAGSLGAEGCAHVGRAVRELLQASVGEYDMVFIDAPPILCFAEPLQLSCISDGVLVVCKAGVTSREAVASVLSTLQRLGATTLGIVLNQIRPQMSATYSAYSSYSRNRYRLARPA